MLLGGRTVSQPGSPRLLLVKARIDDHLGEASAPSLGPMYLGAVARAAGWAVRCIDTYLEDDPLEALGEAIRRWSPEVVGLSSLTAESRCMHRLARAARSADERVVILAGGAHPSADPDEVLSNEAIDAVAIGEGERTLEDVLGRIRRGEPWREAPGLAVRGPGGGVLRTAARPNIDELDLLPLPAWDLTDVDAYARRRGMSLAGMRRYMPIQTSRGCPYRCTYCHDIQGKRFRGHSVGYVLRMIDELRERHGVFSFDITDDIFNFDAERMMAICDGLIERGPGIGFSCPNGIRADRMTVEQADRMARAGCEYVAIGIETAAARLQKQIRKHLRFDKVRPIIDAFTRREVFTAGFFMVGFPSETEAELQATIDFATSSSLHAAYFFVVTPFGGTEMQGEIAAQDPEAVQIGGSGMYYRPKKNLSRVPDARFAAMRRNAYLRFYLDPSRIARIWRAHPRKWTLFEYAATMLARDALRIDPGPYLAWLARVRGEGRAGGGRGASPPPDPARASAPARSAREAQRAARRPTSTAGTSST